MSPVPLREGVYAGVVSHHRKSPREHRLRYTIFQILIDLEAPDAGLRWFRRSGFGLLSFDERGHGPDKADTVAPLKTRMAEALAPLGMFVPGDRMFLMTMPRVLGFVFNPISLYFIEGAAGLRCVVYEVNNTFGDRHSYVLPVDGDGVIRQNTAKRLHVSPFMDMDMAYDFELTAPGEQFFLHIGLRSLREPEPIEMLTAVFAAHRQPLSDAVLWRQFWSLPLMTFKVVWGIHWEALQIWSKGISLRPKPLTPRSGISLS